MTSSIKVSARVTTDECPIVKGSNVPGKIADINRKLAGIETILLFTEPELTCISSTTVRELLQFGKDISQFIPEGMDI